MQLCKEVDHMTDNTIKFTVPSDDADHMRRTLREVFDALNEKGYNPINQIVGYLLTEDPTYITNYNSARSLICKLDRDELLQELVQCYLFDKQ
jgi:YD repeat-containing protein